MFDGSVSDSGSGSGCFELTTVSGLCDVSLKIHIIVQYQSTHVHVFVKKMFFSDSQNIHENIKTSHLV